MPDESPSPITPEGKRAADRIRSIFFMIAAANIVLIGIVMTLNWSTRTEHTNAEARAIAEMEEVLNRAQAAYNATDREGFLACFSTKTGAATDPEFFQRKIEDGYRKKFGGASGNKFLASRLDASGSGGALVRGVQCDKQHGAQLHAEFVRESDAMKLTDWRIEQP